MKKIYTAILVFTLVASCKHATNQKTQMPVSSVDYMTNRTVRFMNLFKCDSVHTRNNILNAYFSFSKPNFDEIQKSQFTNYALAFIDFHPDKVDTVVYHYASKYHPVGQAKRMETVHDFYNHRVITNALFMKQILNDIFVYERESEDNLFLHELNVDFAKAKHGNEISKRAEIGIDAVEIIYNYIREYQDSLTGPNHQILETYEKSISDKSGPNKIYHEKLLKTIHKTVNR